MKERIILGIDPGTIVMGIAVLRQQGLKLESLLIDNFDLKLEIDYIVKLKKIYEKIIEIIEIYKPDEMAIECPFLGENVQSMLKLGRAQGVVMAACLSRGIPVKEYMPKKIKMAISGNGNASKEQVKGMVKNILKLKESQKSFDGYDAMAVAVCHYLNTGKNNILEGKNNTIKTKKVSWDSFVKNNKERIL